MTKSMVEQWLDSNDQNRRVYAQEGFILDVSESIYELLEKKGISARQLAKKLKVSKPRVSKMLDGTSNLTLRTLADIAHVLDEKIEVRFSGTQRYVKKVYDAPCIAWNDTGDQIKLVASNDHVAHSRKVFESNNEWLKVAI